MVTVAQRDFAVNEKALKLRINSIKGIGKITKAAQRLKNIKNGIETLGEELNIEIPEEDL